MKIFLFITAILTGRLNTLFLLTVKDYGEVFGDISRSMKTRTPFSEPISATQVKQQDLEPE